MNGRELITASMRELERARPSRQPSPAVRGGVRRPTGCSSASGRSAGCVDDMRLSALRVWCQSNVRCRATGRCRSICALGRCTLSARGCSFAGAAKRNRPRPHDDCAARDAGADRLRRRPATRNLQARVGGCHPAWLGVRFAARTDRRRRHRQPRHLREISRLPVAHPRHEPSPMHRRRKAVPPGPRPFSSRTQRPIATVQQRQRGQRRHPQRALEADPIIRRNRHAALPHRR